MRIKFSEMKATFHRNLNAKNGNAWSYVVDGKATQAKSIFAQFVTVKQPSGKKFEACLTGGNRGVFAWLKSNEVWANGKRVGHEPKHNFQRVAAQVWDDYTPDIPDNAVRIRFNPKNGQKFFQTEDGAKVDSMTQVWCKENGECWAIL